MASACDLCSVYSAFHAAGELEAEFQAGFAGQFTHFGTLQYEGDQVTDLIGQRLDSSVTQLLAGWNLRDNAGVQLNVPLVYRSFRRPEGWDIDEGSESGVGDLVVSGHYPF